VLGFELRASYLLQRPFFQHSPGLMDFCESEAPPTPSITHLFAATTVMLKPAGQGQPCRRTSSAAPPHLGKMCVGLMDWCGLLQLTRPKINSVPGYNLVLILLHPQPVCKPITMTTPNTYSLHEPGLPSPGSMTSETKVLLRLSWMLMWKRHPGCGL
jgi:hypothetical protein